MPKFFRPHVVFQPDSYLGMQSGINQMADAIRPTLGPLPRIVAVERSLRHRAPDLLDNGGVIAQRIIELPNRGADMGAMFLRHVLQYVRDQCGDGTATAAVLLQSIYNEGLRYIVAGGNPMRLRHHLKSGTWAILTELNQQTVQLKGRQNLARIAESICHDPPLAKLIGEIFDIIGEYGRLEIRVGNSRLLEREYIEGLYWNSSVVSREMITDQEKLRIQLGDTLVLMSNFDFGTAAQLVPVIKVAKSAGASSLLVIAAKFSNEAVALMLANSKPDEFQAIGVKTPGIGMTKQNEALQDLSKIIGGRVFLQGLDQSNLDKLTLQEMGQARRVWADLTHFGIIGGKGDPRELRRHIAKLRTALGKAEGAEKRELLRERAGKLISGSAVLKIGGSTNSEIRARKASAERTADAVRGAMTEGVVPGGGVALLNCRSVLQTKLDQATDTDERAAYGILIRAVEEPIRTIAANAGCEPSQVLARISQAGTGSGFDVRSEQIVNMAEAGIYDSASVIKTAVQSAVASAALALTTGVLVHHKNPKPPSEAGTGDYWYRT